MLLMPLVRRFCSRSGIAGITRQERQCRQRGVAAAVVAHHVTSFSAAAARTDESTCNAASFTSHRHRCRHTTPEPQQRFLSSSAAKDHDSGNNSNNSSSNSNPHWSLPQRKLLQEALKHHVPKLGFTPDAIAAAAAATAASQPQLSIAMAGVVTVSDLVTFCMHDWNERWRADLPKRQPPVGTSRVERLAQAFQLRLRYCLDDRLRHVWPAAMAWGARPDHIATTQAQLRDMVKIVVEAEMVAAGDTEPTWAGQVGLGAVYVAAELHMLSDSSVDCADTWVFLRQQLHHWAQLAGLLPLAGMISVPPFLSFSTGGRPAALPIVQDAWYVTSSVALALASGAASLVLPPDVIRSVAASAPVPFTAPWSSSSKEERQPPANNDNDGTDPSHYDATTQPLASNESRSRSAV